MAIEAADLLAGVDQGRGHARVRGVKHHGTSRCSAHSRTPGPGRSRPAAGTAGSRPGSWCAGPVAGSQGWRGPPAAISPGQPGSAARARPAASVPAVRRGRHHDRRDHRQEGQAGLDRRVGQGQLQVVGQEQEDPERTPMADGPMARYAPPPETVQDDPQRQQRMRRPGALRDQHERGQQDRPGYQQRQGGRRAPALGGGLRAARRPPPPARLSPGPFPASRSLRSDHGAVAASNSRTRARDRDHRQDDVDVRAPPPGRVLGQHPAQQQPHRPACPGDGAEGAEGLEALGRVGERDCSASRARPEPASRQTPPASRGRSPASRSCGRRAAQR